MGKAGRTNKKVERKEKDQGADVSKRSKVFLMGVRELEAGEAGESQAENGLGGGALV